MSHRGIPASQHSLSPAQELAETLIAALQDFAHPGQGGYPRGVRGKPHEQYTDDFFIYPVSLGALTAVGGAGPVSAVANIQIQADSDFEWIESTFGAFITGAAAGVYTDAMFLPINAQIVDSGSGRQLFNAPLPISNFAGSGKQPFILPVPRKFMARSNIQVTVTNTDPTNGYSDIFLNFIGRKIFKFGPQR